ncbi:DUF1572 family protein [Cytobacillus sp. Hz8]|uniref:DUF1572 family protein n=1 Tax=Cytobacillus sp. Hz8 TaxID=3347168 RepID=UPI0035D5F646
MQRSGFLVSFELEYLRVIKDRFHTLKDLGEKTIEQLTEQDIHWNLNQQSNSVAIIVKHISGNMISRWTDFLHSDGEKPTRQRDQEFIDTLSSKKELMKDWEAGWNTLFHAINDLNENNLLQTIYIRGEGHSVVEAIERQFAHYAYHIGQIVYIGKQLKGRDWKNLSVPFGESEQYLQQRLEKHLSDKPGKLPKQ